MCRGVGWSEVSAILSRMGEHYRRKEQDYPAQEAALQSERQIVSLKAESSSTVSQQLQSLADILTFAWIQVYTTTCSRPV